MKLIFVYNANSGRINSWLDIGHKLISPNTYSCDLCSLTHGVFSEREEWKQYRESSSVEMEFLHKDEFEKKYGGNHGFDYPVILQSDDGGELSVLMDAKSINALDSLDLLIEQLPR